MKVIKILAIVLLVSASIFAMLLPLDGGLESNSIIADGKLKIDITGTNTHFKDADEVYFWLSTNDSARELFCPASITIQDNNSATLTFKTDTTTKPTFYNVFASTSTDGTMMLKNGVFARQVIVSADNSYRNPLESTIVWKFPNREILAESIRNIFFHVPMWFAMMTMYLISMVFAIIYLVKKNLFADYWASEFVNTGTLFGILGMLTGMVWAQFTWGKFWSFDIKQITSSILLMIYFAYIILRSAFTDSHQRAKLSAVYNIFAALTIVPLIFIIPNSSSGSLHPGNAGNPAFKSYDLDNIMRIFFYPAILGWIFLGVWITYMYHKYRLLQHRLLTK